MWQVDELYHEAQ